MSDPTPAPAPHADTIEVSPEVLRDLRRDRRRRRVAGIEWFEALYRAYLTGGIGIMAVLFLSSAVGDDPLSPSSVDDVRRLAPALVGVVAAVVAAVGLRAGSRGGPLALEKAEVTHVLLAPVDRRRALLVPALRQVRFAAFAGAVAGAIAGQPAGRQLTGDRTGHRARERGEADLAERRDEQGPSPVHRRQQDVRDLGLLERQRPASAAGPQPDRSDDGGDDADERGGQPPHVLDAAGRERIVSDGAGEEQHRHDADAARQVGAVESLEPFDAGHPAAAPIAAQVAQHHG